MNVLVVAVAIAVAVAADYCLVEHYFVDQYFPSRLHLSKVCWQKVSFGPQDFRMAALDLLNWQTRMASRRRV